MKLCPVVAVHAVEAHQVMHITPGAGVDSLELVVDAAAVAGGALVVHARAVLELVLLHKAALHGIGAADVTLSAGDVASLTARRERCLEVRVTGGEPAAGFEGGGVPAQCVVHALLVVISLSRMAGTTHVAGRRGVGWITDQSLVSGFLGIPPPGALMTVEAGEFGVTLGQERVADKVLLVRLQLRRSSASPLPRVLGSGWFGFGRRQQTGAAGVARGTVVQGKVRRVRAIVVARAGRACNHQQQREHCGDRTPSATRTHGRTSDPDWLVTGNRRFGSPHVDMKSRLIPLVFNNKRV